MSLTIYGFLGLNLFSFEGTRMWEWGWGEKGMVRRETSRKEPWSFALCWFNKENFVVFSKLIFKTLIIQWNHCYNTGDR